MMICPNCKNQFEEGTKFCGNCGFNVAAQPVEETPVQSAPEEVAVQEVATAPETEVSSEVSATPEVAVDATPAVSNELTSETKPEKKAGISSKMLIGIGGAAVALLLVIILAFSLIIPAFSSAPSPIVYYKDGELSYLKAANKDAYELTSDYSDGEYTFGYLLLSEDGKRLFYPDKCDSDGYTLYYRNPDKPKKDAVKVDSNVNGYIISDKGDYVVYEKGDNYYWSNLKDKDKIIDCKTLLAMTSDGKEICFTDEDGDLYTMKFGRDKVKLESGVENVEYVSDDLSLIYFIKNDKLYRIKNGKDAEKIAEDVSYVIDTFEGGEMYYVVKSEGAYSFDDIVDDDMAAIDNALTEPVRPTAPSISDYDSYNEWSDAYDEYYDEYDVYWDEYEEYQDKLDRDEMREALKEALEEGVETKSLYYYTGSKSVLVSENYSGYNSGCEITAIAYEVTSTEVDSKLQLSEIFDSYYYYDADEIVSEALTSSVTTCLAVEDKTITIGEDIGSVHINNDASCVYYTQYVEDEDGYITETELYKAKVSGSKLGKEELVNGEIYSVIGIMDDKIVYLKDADEEESTAELYVDDKNVDSDAYTYYYYYTISEDNELYYVADYDADEDTYTLKKYDSKVTQLAEDVSYYEMAADGQVYIICDYEDGEGDLYAVKGKKIVLIDEDVEDMGLVYNVADVRDAILA